MEEGRKLELEIDKATKVYSHELSEFKQKKLELRKAKTDFESYTREINEIGIKLSNLEQKDQKSELTADNKYQAMLSKVFEEYFENIGEFVPIDVEFEHQKVCFQIQKDTTFLDLRNKVGNYWSLPTEEIFFSDSKPSNSNPMPSLYVLSDTIVSQVYMWNSFKFSENAVLYIVLRQYVPLSEKINLISPEINLKSNSDPEDCDLSPLTKEERVISQSNQELLQKVMKTNFKFYVLQSIVFLCLFGIWVASVYFERKVTSASQMNDLINSDLFWKFELNLKVPFSYGVTNDSELMKISNEKTFWNYISYLEELIYLRPLMRELEEGSLAGSIGMLGYLQFRQIRSNAEVCEHAYIEDFLCPEPYFSWNENKEDFGTNEGFTYQEPESSDHLFGFYGVYHMGGFFLEVPHNNYSVWNSKKHMLISNNWYDLQTRLITVSMNFAAPSKGIISTGIAFLEVDVYQNILPGFKIYSLNYQLFEGSVTWLLFLVVFLALVLLVIEVRHNLKLKAEISYFEGAFGQTEFPGNLYGDICSHRSKKLWKRFRKPSFREFVCIATILTVFVVELAKFGWLAGKFNSTIKDIKNNQYNDLVPLMEGWEIIGNTESFIAVLLGISMMRYTMFWVKKVRMLYLMLVKSVKDSVGFLLVGFLPVMGFTVCYMYMIGTYDMHTNRIDSAYLSVLKLFFGGWSSSLSFQYYIPIELIVVSAVLFLYWRFVLLNMFVANLVWESK